jgi:two-component system response regulator
MDRTIKILILEDSAEDVDLVQRELKRGAIEFVSAVVNSREGYENALIDFRPDVILSDHSLPQFNAVEAMEIWKKFQEKEGVVIPFILITGSMSEELAVLSMKAGADDYILKDRLKRLPSSIRSALEKVKLEQERVNYLSEMLIQSKLMKEAEHLANFGSWQVDLSSGKHQWSDEAFRIFGFTPGEIDPDYEKFFKHVHPEDKAALKQMIGEAINNQHFQQCEYRIVDKDGYAKTLLSKILVKRDASHRAYQLIGFTLDVTEQKNQTRALEMQNQKLMEIAWVQSHEVRAPLARLMGLVQLLIRSEQNGNIEDVETMKHIVRSANELDEIIRRIVRKTEEIF